MTALSRNPFRGCVTCVFLIWALFWGSADAGAPSSVPPQMAEVSYFVSVRARHGGVHVNVRSGPGQNYPIEWTIVRAHWPLEVLRKFEHWRHVRDVEGNTGWIHKNMLSGKRTVIFRQPTYLYKKPNTTSPMLAQVDHNVIAHPLTCEGTWCRIRIEHMKGWVQRATLWGGI